MCEREGEREGGEGRGGESLGKVRCGEVGVVVWCESAVLCVHVCVCVLVVCLLCTPQLLLCPAVCLVPVGWLPILQVRFLLSVPLPSSTTPLLPLPCPALPYRTPSLQACHGPIPFSACYGYFTSLFALRTVVGRAPRQPAQGSKAHTHPNSRPGCQGRVRHASGSRAIVALPTP